MEIKGNEILQAAYECGRSLGQMEGYLKALKDVREARQ